MGWILAAAAISAAAAIASQEMQAGRGKQPGATSVGEKKPFEMPDLFKNKNGPLMGGGQKQGFNLSQDLTQPTPVTQATPQFGPTGGGAFDDLERKRQLAAMFGGM